jgi:hypothetical protein
MEQKEHFLPSFHKVFLFLCFYRGLFQNGARIAPFAPWFLGGVSPLFLIILLFIYFLFLEEKE